jgi:hypothetical protein
MSCASISRFAGKALLGAVVVLTILATAEGAVRDKLYMWDANNDMYLWTDPDAGCQYLVTRHGGMLPRIAADGKTHMGCKGVK